MSFRKLITKLLAFILLFNSLLLCDVETVQAEDYWPSGVDVVAESAIIMEQETGTILYSKNMDEVHYPASITKIMTALIVLENCQLDETVVFSAEAVYGTELGSSSIARDVNEEMTVEQTLYGMMLESANECAYALGEHVAGSMSAFVDMMNAKAKELGCKNTHFNNSNGLPDEEHYTSAYDMALIARAAYQIPKFAEIVGTKNYTIPPTNKHSDPTPLNNHHQMLHYYKTNKYIYEPCLGGKTGYTVVAGATLVTYAKKDGMTLICVVMKDTVGEQYTDTTNLFEYCFNNFSKYSVADFASISENDTDVTGILSENSELIKIDKNGLIVIPKTASVLDVTSTVEPFTDENDKSVVGQIRYTYADRSVGQANLKFANADVESYPFDNLPVEKGGSGKEYIQVDYPKIGLSILAVIIVILIILYIRSKSSEILLMKHRFKSKHARPQKTNMTIIRDNGKKHRRRR
ncbi:D-alanyl-D-alanine carboxypeptidase family protein [Pseudobutyrivibrio xylanivorans]|uniref:D-alanyl-D-alanine carboxypeptidase n=1 Tax=Pseudobutyrivibrio xylanivorans TaxID=185007 RepID=A0A5P6VR58_PSEXY|nr:D-alanyl-D-alanine carboxypeptidase family protein [Pseudobutyrivibrio xylanivorans]QFJ54169.1 D-alanyl-D-alanine carboxypeptidase [Pseudobutyrivibrio xylanivorans]